MTERNASAYAALLLRVSMGVLFIAHGLLLKLLEYGMSGTVQYFTGEGYPAILAYAVVAGEIVGGLMLVAGMQVRAVAIALVPLMIGATYEHVGNGWMFGNAGGGYEFPLFWTMTLLVQALLGPGAHALRLPAKRKPVAQPALA